MVGAIKWFPKPRIMRIKYGKGKLRARVAGTYMRVIDGKRHKSYHIKALDRKRLALKCLNRKEHHAYEQTCDSPKSRI